MTPAGPADWRLTLLHHDLEAKACEAVARVTALHTTCDCGPCMARTNRFCGHCHQYWPCPTVQAVRGTTARPTTEPAT